MQLSCTSLNVSETKKQQVDRQLKKLMSFEYVDYEDKKLSGWQAYGPIAELIIRKQGYTAEQLKPAVERMIKTFALLLAYSPEEEQIELTFAPLPDRCLHALCQITSLKKQLETHIDRVIYHYPFINGEPLEGLRNTTTELFQYHFGEDPFGDELPTSCSSCCIIPNPVLPIPTNW